MIDTATEATCKACGKPIIQKAGGHRLRVYCNATCKMRDRRQRADEHKQVQLSAELAAAHAKITTQDAKIAALQARVRDLERRLWALNDVNGVPEVDRHIPTLKLSIGL